MTRLDDLREMAYWEVDDCVLWPWAINSAGYAHLKVGRRWGRGHRLVCEWRHGPPPFEAADAAHSCGVRACVNYRHLRWATRAENFADKLLHGTDNRGEKHVFSRLTEADVQAIRRARGIEKQDVLAARYGVTQSMVSRIQNGHRWQHARSSDGLEGVSDE